MPMKNLRLGISVIVAALFFNSKVYSQDSLVTQTPAETTTGAPALNQSTTQPDSNVTQNATATDTEAATDKALASQARAYHDEFSPDAIVCPDDADADHYVDLVREAMGLETVQRISTIAMDEASKKLSFGPLASRAVVLGRRAIKPGREWGRINPLHLELAPLHEGVERAYLHTVLKEAKLISSWNRRQKKAPRPRTGIGQSSLLLPCPDGTSSPPPPDCRWAEMPVEQHRY